MILLIHNTGATSYKMHVNDKKNLKYYSSLVLFAEGSHHC